MHNKPLPLYGSVFKKNPYPTYQRLMSSGRLHSVEFPSGVRGWLVTGYDAAVQVLSDSRLGKDHTLGNARWRSLASIMPEPQHTQLQAHLLHQDPPKHTRMRSLISSAFSSARIQPFRGRIEAILSELVDPIIQKGEADLIADVAAKLPLRILAEVIGLSDVHRQQFQRHWCKAVQPVGPADPGRAAYIQLLSELQSYIDLVVSESRGGDMDRLIVRLIAAHDAGVISYHELTSMIFQLLAAGQEPVTNQIGNAMLALLLHPEQMAKLKENPALIEKAVEELLRYDGAFEISTWRFFSQPTQLFDVTIPAGDSVIVALDAANRDAAKFACPHQLNLERKPETHLSFGYGRHFCPAAPLARLELELSIQIMLERLPNLKLACPVDELRWIPAVLSRGIQSLPVVYTQRT